MEQVDNLLKHEYLIHPKYFISGQFSQKFHCTYVSFVVLIFIVISVIAQISYPDQYSILIHTISHQGSIIFNPKGHRLWNIGVFLIGFLMVPHFLKLFHIFKPLSSIISAISSGLGVVSSVSLSFVGLFPLDFRQPHFVFAGVCFGGIFITANLYLVLLIRRVIHAKNITQPPIVSKIVVIGLIYLVFNVGFIMMAITYQLNGGIVAIWEWFYFICIILWLLASLMIRSILK